MLALEISINGKRLCVAATTPNAVLATGLTWTKREPTDLRFNVGGVTGDDTGNHFNWNVPDLNVGDEISIRIIETERYDEPDGVYHPADKS